MKAIVTLYRKRFPIFFYNISNHCLLPQKIDTTCCQVICCGWRFAPRYPQALPQKKICTLRIPFGNNISSCSGIWIPVTFIGVRLTHFDCRCCYSYNLALLLQLHDLTLGSSVFHLPLVHIDLDSLLKVLIIDFVWHSFHFLLKWKGWTKKKRNSESVLDKFACSLAYPILAEIALLSSSIIST